MPSKFRVVCLDAGETLVHPRPTFAEAFTRICREWGLELAQPQAAGIEIAGAQRLFEYQRRGLKFSDSTESSREFWVGLYRDFLATADVPEGHLDGLPEFLYDRFTRAENYCLFDDALPALEALRARGFLLGVVSNWEAWLDRLLAELSIKHLFDFVVISGIVGHEKPDPRIYQAAIDSAGVDPTEMIHVGDSLHSDVLGARAVGITPILLDRYGRHRDADCLRVTRLDELTSTGGPLDSYGAPELPNR